MPLQWPWRKRLSASIVIYLIYENLLRLFPFLDNLVSPVGRGRPSRKTSTVRASRSRRGHPAKSNGLWVVRTRREALRTRPRSLPRAVARFNRARPVPGAGRGAGKSPGGGERRAI